MGEILKRRKGLIMRKNCKTFKEWCKSQATEFGAICEKASHLSVSCYTSDFGTSVKCNIVNERIGKTGISSVKADNFDDPNTIAIALAWADYKKRNHPLFYGSSRCSLCPR